MSVHSCPHCRVRSNFDQPVGLHPFQALKYTYRVCQNCGGPVYVRWDPDNPEGALILYPSIRTEAPTEYPPDIGENYVEALRSLNVGNFKACVVMARSALQAATRQLNAQGKSLRDEIDDLAGRHIIPDSLRQWAHEIRDGGNLVAHPEPGQRVQKEDAEELMALVESVFEYLYVVPQQVQQRRLRLSQPP